MADDSIIEMTPGGPRALKTDRTGSGPTAVHVPYVRLDGSSTVAAQGTYTDRTVTNTAAAASTSLMPANAARRKWVIQAPQTADLWINPLGGTAGPNLAGCIFIPSKGVLASDEFVSTAAITYYCATGGLAFFAAEG